MVINKKDSKIIILIISHFLNHLDWADPVFGETKSHPQWHGKHFWVGLTLIIGLKESEKYLINNFTPRLNCPAYPFLGLERKTIE